MEKQKIWVLAATGSVTWTLCSLYSCVHVTNIAWGRCSLPTEAIHDSACTQGCCEMCPPNGLCYAALNGLCGLFSVNASSILGSHVVFPYKISVHYCDTGPKDQQTRCQCFFTVHWLLLWNLTRGSLCFLVMYWHALTYWQMINKKRQPCGMFMLLGNLLTLACFSV